MMMGWGSIGAVGAIGAVSAGVSFGSVMAIAFLTGAELWTPRKKSSATAVYTMEGQGDVGGRSSRLYAHAIRLKPGDELKSSLLRFAREQGICAGVIISCVGSLKHARIRLAAATSENAPNKVVSLEGKHEIVSLVGTLSGNGDCHLHVSLADEAGNVRGGHVLDEMIIFTTAELVIGECQDLIWNREIDDATGFDELKVAQRC